MNNKTQFLIIGVLTLIIGGAIVFLLNQRDMREEELGGMHLAEGIANLPSVEQAEIVKLKDGDTYKLTASFVKKNINSREVKMLAYWRYG